MRERPNQQGDATPAPRASEPASPNWDLVLFDVTCARCGNDLRGLVDPVCPACKLEFDWSVAVPVEHLTCEKCEYHLMGLSETRCPECGTWFTWNEALDAYRRRQKPLFEYRWRERPVRSLIRTWFMALRPKRFWSTLDIHDPPQVRPLIVVAVLALLAYAGAMVVCHGLYYWLWSAATWSVTGTRVTQAPSLADLPSHLIYALWNLELHTLLPPTALWMILSPVALLVFQQSMRMCKIRASHLIRVGAYSVPLMLPGAVVIGYLPSMLRPLGLVTKDYDIDPALAVFILAHVTWSIRCAYVYYLRMPHAAAVAIASQAMAILGTFSVCALIYDYYFVASILLRLGHVLGIG